MYKPDNQILTEKLIAFLQNSSNKHIDILELATWIEINTNYQATIIYADYINYTLNYLDTLTDFAMQVEKNQKSIIKRLLFRKQDIEH